MLESVKQKLEEILDKEIVINNHLSSEQDIRLFENKFGVELPKEYTEFLGNYVQLYIKDNYQFPMIQKSKITPTNGYETMDFLYSGDFLKNAEQYIKNYGKEIVPIGEASGDYICLGLVGENYGKIYYWYHEDEAMDSHYYLIAQSFNEFILSFEQYTEDSINLDDIEIELDDDLWND